MRALECTCFQQIDEVPRKSFAEATKIGEDAEHSDSVTTYRDVTCELFCI